MDSGHETGSDTTSPPPPPSSSSSRPSTKSLFLNTSPAAATTTGELSAANLRSVAAPQRHLALRRRAEDAAMHSSSDVDQRRSSIEGIVSARRPSAHSAFRDSAVPLSSQMEETVHHRLQMAQGLKNEADQVPVDDMDSSCLDGANDGFVGGAEEFGLRNPTLKTCSRLHRHENDTMIRVLGRSQLRPNHKMPESCSESIFSVGRHQTQFGSRGSKWVETNLSDEEVSSTSGSLVIDLGTTLAWQSSYEGFEI